MKKLTNRMLTDRFIELFQGDQAFTSSEKRLMGIKLTQLRKTVNEYINENNIETSLTVNDIILDCIEYSAMVNKPFRSISSLGYDVLPKSIGYWKKRRALEEERQSNYSIQESENYTSKDEKVIDKVITESYNKTNKSNRPSWMNLGGW